MLEDLRKRLLDISYRHKLSHIGSCLTALPIIYEIYEEKKADDLFVLSAGHSGLALYVILEHFNGCDAEELLKKHGIHPCLDLNNGVVCSTGSLGLGILIGVGMALASPQKTVYILTTDGESFEGSFWEALRFVRQKDIPNVKIFCNVNGYTAYEKIDKEYLIPELKMALPTINVRLTDSDLPFAKACAAHYHVMSEEEYKSLI